MNREEKRLYELTEAPYGREAGHWFSESIAPFSQTIFYAPDYYKLVKEMYEFRIIDEAWLSPRGLTQDEAKDYRLHIVGIDSFILDNLPLIQTLLLISVREWSFGRNIFSAHNTGDLTIEGLITDWDDICRHFIEDEFGIKMFPHSYGDELFIEIFSDWLIERQRVILSL